MPIQDCSDPECPCLLGQAVKQWVDDLEKRKRHVAACLTYYLVKANELGVNTLLADAFDLHAEVEMGESQGICLRDRVPSLRLGDSLLSLGHVDLGEDRGPAWRRWPNGAPT